METIVLIGSNYDKNSEVFCFFFHNTETNWYYEMYCKNSSGTKDMHERTSRMTREQFISIAKDRLV